MKRLVLFYVLVTFVTFVIVSRACAQASGNATMLLFPGVPTGTCHPRQLAMNLSNGALYSCNNGAWQPLTGGGGGGVGTVTSFNAGNLAPLFTTSVSNPSSTPGLTFFLNNVPANTILGNFTNSSNPPNWFAPSCDISLSGGSFTINRLTFTGSSIPLGAPPATGQFLTFNGTSIVGGTPTGGGGGTGLLGCATATSGNLTCDNSVAVTASGGGTLSLASGALPTPPSGPTAMLVADAAGHPFWSNGSGTQFTELGGAGPATTLQFSGGTVLNLGAPPASGQCLLNSGTALTGGPCGGGTGGGGATGGVTVIQ